MYPNMKLRDNRSWDNWGSNGYIFGILLIILGIVTQVLEYPRIYNGPTNEGNGLYLISNYYNHWWPWTYAASIFGLFTLFTGFMGILAGNRRSYGSILGFFMMCLFSTLFAIYLIVYFSFIISFYRSMNKDKSNFRTPAESVAYGLASTQLAMACVNVLISLMGAIFSGRAIALCVPKGVFYDDVQPIPYRPYPNRY
jgi:magnesium-transporting ATPase (P-type)